MKTAHIIHLILIFPFYLKTMVIHEYFPELFPKYKTTSEYHAYILLKNNPLKKAVNYLAVPWQCISFEEAVQTLQNLKLNGGFTVIDDDIFEKYVPLLQKIGIDTIFANSANNNTFENINVIAMPFLSMNGTNPSNNKHL